MKIDKQHAKLPVQDQQIQKGKEALAQKRIDQKRSANAGNVKTSSFTINRARERIDAEPDVNMERVNALKAAIRKGEYQVDSTKLADNLLKNSLFEDI